MIYLDNSATTYKKPLSVKLTAIYNILKNVGNPGRGGHSISLRAGQIVLDTREKIKEFFNAPDDSNVVFTQNCTESLNLAIFGSYKENGHIITTAYEHNSVLRPLKELEKQHNVKFSIIKPNENGEINLNDIKKEMRSNTYMIIINHTSNVTGHTTDIKAIGEYAKSKNLIFLVDSAQSAGHEKIDVVKHNINLLAIAGHKGLYGIQGIGALIINNVNIKPIKLGGTGTNSIDLSQPIELPESLESGTLNTISISALNSALKWVTKNQTKINKHTEMLYYFFMEKIKHIKEIKVYSKNPKSGVFSISVDNFSSNEIANILNEKYNICIRSGLHCAPLIHLHYGTYNSGLIRISVSLFSKKSDITKLINALKEIIYS